MRRADSSTSGMGGLGIGLREGVSITTHLAKCLRRPIGLMTSLKMIDEGHDYERCCEQLLLDIAVYGSGGGSTGGGGGSSRSRRGTTTSLRHNTSASFLGDISGAEQGVEEKVDAEALQREEEALLNDGGHVGELGARILNCAKRVAPFEDALRDEEEVHRLRLLRKNGGSDTISTQVATSVAQGVVMHSAAIASGAAPLSPSSLATVRSKKIPLGTRRFPEDDDDMTTQLFRNDFTIADIQRQGDILHAQQNMVEALRERLGGDEEGQALLRSKLYRGGLFGGRSPSAKARQVSSLLDESPMNGALSSSVAPTTTTANKVAASTTSTAGVTQMEPHRSMHYLDSWEWSTSPSKRLLPVIKNSTTSQTAMSVDSATQHLASKRNTKEHSTIMAPPMRASCNAAAVVDVSTPLKSAVRLPPLAAPVSFNANVPSRHLMLPTPSPLRIRSQLTRHLADTTPTQEVLPAIIHKMSEHQKNTRSSEVNSHDGEDKSGGVNSYLPPPSVLQPPHLAPSHLHSALSAAAMRTAESAYGRILLLGSDDDNVEAGGEVGNGVPLWSFEREQCFRDGIKDLEDFYSPQRLFRVKEREQ